MNSRSAALHIIHPTPSMVAFTEKAAEQIFRLIETHLRDPHHKWSKTPTLITEGTYQGNGFTTTAKVLLRPTSRTSIGGAHANFSRTRKTAISTITIHIPDSSMAYYFANQATWLEIEGEVSLNMKPLPSLLEEIENSVMHEVIHSVDPDCMVSYKGPIEPLMDVLPFVGSILYMIKPALMAVTSLVYLTYNYWLIKKKTKRLPYVTPEESFEGYLNQKCERTAFVSALSQSMRARIHRSGLEPEALSSLTPEKLAAEMEAKLPPKLIAIISHDPKDLAALKHFLSATAARIIEETKQPGPPG